MAMKGKEFLRDGLLGVLVITLTPILAGLLSGFLGGFALLTQDLLFGISLLTFASAAVVTWSVNMGLGKIKAFR